MVTKADVQDIKADLVKRQRRRENVGDSKNSSSSKNVDVQPNEYMRDPEIAMSCWECQNVMYECGLT